MIINENEKKIVVEKLYDFIDKNCIFRCNPDVKYNHCSDKGFITAKGTNKNNMSYQFFLRRLTHNPIALEWVSILFLNDMVIKIREGKENSKVQLAGLETGSLPIISAVQMQARKFNIPLNAFTVRKDRKSYGLFNYIEGMPNENSIIYVDDLINSGSSLRNCYNVVKYELGNDLANNSYFIIDLNNERTHIKIDENLVACNSIFKKEDFDMEYDEEKYWLPKDCDKSYNKRPEYF